MPEHPPALSQNAGTEAFAIETGLLGLLHGLASLFLLSLGDTDAARREADNQLEIARSTANPSMLTFALANTGRAWFAEDPDRALADFEESVALTRAGAADGSYS